MTDRKMTKREIRTQKIIDSFRGKPGEFDMLKGVLCMTHYLDDAARVKLDTIFDGIMIAARMDQLNAAALEQIKL